MATLEQLAEGIRRANAKGDINAVKTLGAAYRQMQSASGPAFEAASAASQKLAGPIPERPGEGYVEQGMSGVNEGLANMLGLPVDITTGVMNAGLGLAGIPGIENPAFGSQSWKERMGRVGATTPETDDPGKQMARRIGQEVGSAAVPILGAAGSVARPGAMIAKELALALGSGTGGAIGQQLDPDSPLGEIAGQLMGAGGVAGLTGIAKKAITPFRITPERQAAVDALRREGVDLTAGQQTGSKGLQYAESELGGGRVADAMDTQAQQFTRAVLSRAGIGADRATPQVVNSAFQRIGDEFDNVAARNTLRGDQAMATELRDVVSEYHQLVAPSERAPIIENTLRDLVGNLRASGGSLTGEQYKALRSRLDRAQRATKDPELRGALVDIRGTLDDAMERSIANANPNDLGAWRQVRNDYRNMLVIERAITGAGEAAASGLISPAALRQATVGAHGRRSYARGTSDFSELAHAGNETMAPLPQSGTAPRTAVRNLGAPMLSAVGAAAGSPGGIPGMLAGAAAGAAVPALAGRALLSGPGRRYLTNQLVRGAPSGSNGIGPLAGLLTGQTANDPDTALQRAIAQQLLAAH